MVVFLLIFLLYILPTMALMFVMWIIARWEGKTFKEMWGKYIEMCFVPVINIVHLCVFIFALLYVGFYAIGLNILFKIKFSRQRSTYKNRIL